MKRGTCPWVWTGLAWVVGPSAVADGTPAGPRIGLCRLANGATLGEHAKKPQWRRGQRTFAGCGAGDAHRHGRRGRNSRGRGCVCRAGFSGVAVGWRGGVTRADAEWGKKGKVGPGMRAGPRSGAARETGFAAESAEEGEGIEVLVELIGAHALPFPNPRQSAATLLLRARCHLAGGFGGAQCATLPDRRASWG